MHISFFYEEIDFKLKQPRKVRQWLNICASNEGFQIQMLSFVFCNDDFLLQINKRYLNHATLTDIITFDLSSKKSSIVGEVYISIPRVLENSSKFKDPFEDELHRVMVHGLLHLCGYDDKAKRQKLLMRQKESTCLSLYPK
jgi:rRNA maturation RNase YbeY